MKAIIVYACSWVWLLLIPVWIYFLGNAIFFEFNSTGWGKFLMVFGLSMVAKNTVRVIASR